MARYDRALSMVTASDSVNLRMGPVPGTPEGTHARYRSRPGAGIAVVTSLGTVEPDTGGSARLIAEDPALVVLPDVLEVTLEPRPGSATPGERVIGAWTR